METGSVASVEYGEAGGAVAVEETATATTNHALAAVRAAGMTRGPIRAVKPKTRWSTLARGSNMLLRRTHLYAGLLMLPWVLLYGVTGILFNHPTWFSDQTLYTFDAQQAAGTPMANLVTPPEIARSVVAAVASKTGEPFRFVEREGARFARGGLSASLLIDGKPYSASLDLADGSGLIREGQTVSRGGPGAPPSRPDAAADASKAPAGPEGTEKRGRRGTPGPGPGAETGREPRGETPAADPNDPFAKLGPVAVDPPVLDQLKAALPTIASRAGVPAGQVEVTQVRASALSFLIERGDHTWRASYDLASGALTASPNTPGQGADLSTRRFLLGLHRAHGYPTEFSARWVWAFLTDIMALLMIFWGVSGLIMWWQIKRTRLIGAGALAVSALMSAWVFVEMHQELLGLNR